MKRKYLLLLTVCCSCLLAAFICSGCNNRDSSQKHTDVKNHTSAKETVKPYADFKYTDYFNRSNLSLTDRSMDSIDIDTLNLPSMNFIPLLTVTVMKNGFSVSMISYVNN